MKISNEIPDDRVMHILHQRVRVLINIPKPFWKLQVLYNSIIKPEVLSKI